MTTDHILHEVSSTSQEKAKGSRFWYYRDKNKTFKDSRIMRKKR